MLSKNLITYTLLALMVFTIFVPTTTTYAASADDVLGQLVSSTVQSSNGSGGAGLFDKLFSLVFDKILGPVFNIFGGKSTSTSSPVKIIPTTPSTGSLNNTYDDGGVLKGKVIVVDPGHGGSNPGATSYNKRESDNNLAVGLKLRDKLVQAGAKVIMTRSSDKTVAPEGSSLGQELQARIDIAQNNNADIFVSIHTNSNDNSTIEGAMTFYHSDQSQTLASSIQTALVQQTGATNKGTSTANFYVLRNAAMPSILIEMGFISNPDEAARLSDDSYRSNIAQGIFNGLANYFKS